MVIVFATNEERNFRDFGRTVAAERWPQLRAKVENPGPYVSRDRTEAAAVIVHPRWTQIIEDYRAAGAEVLVTDGVLLAPVVEVAPPEPPVVQEVTCEPVADSGLLHPSDSQSAPPVRTGRKSRRRR